MFAAFDTNGDGHIDFTEILVGLSVLLGGTFEEKLDLLFAAFDVDHSETMDCEELAKMVVFLNDSIASDLASATVVAQNLIVKFDTEAGADGAAASGHRDYALNRSEFKAMVQANRWVLGNNWANQTQASGFAKKKQQQQQQGNNRGGGGGGNYQEGGFGTCRNCGKPGHKAKDCASKPSAGKGGGGGGGKGKGGGGGKGAFGNKGGGGGASCANCGRAGHTAAKCFRPGGGAAHGGGGDGGGGGSGW
jgi:hypothetical protein